MKRFLSWIKNLTIYKALKKHLGRFFANFKYNWKCFVTLVMMQLKERLDISFKADKKKSLTKIVLYLVAFAAMIAIIAVVFTILGQLSVFAMGIVPVFFFNVVVYLVVVLDLISVIHKLTNSLYFSQDNQTLLTYPCNNGVIFFSKLAVFYIMDLVKSFVTLVPLFIAYAAVNDFPFFFYPWLVLVFLLLSLVITSVSAVLSLPYKYVLSFFKKYQGIQTIVIIVLAIGASVGVFYLLTLIPKNLQISSQWATVYLPQFRDVTRQIEKYSGPFFYVPALIMGYMGFQTNSTNPRYLKIITNQTGLIALVYLGIITVCIIVAYFVSRPLFFKMASKPFEYSKKFINHDYKLSKGDESIYKFGFKPIYDENLSKKDRKEMVNKLSSLLRKLNHEEKLFLREKVNEKRVAKFLKKYSKEYKFELVPVEQITDIGYIIQVRLNIPFLVLVKGQPRIHLHCYDPYYLGAKNRKKPPIASTFDKDMLVDLRTPGTVASLFLLFIVTPLAIAVLNTTFSAINTSFQGQRYTVAINILIIMLIALASNVSMASIYSREGKASYLLKASPTNYMKSLTVKLIIRAVLMTASLALTILLYSIYSDVHFIKYDQLFFAVWFVYLGHLIWCAELDYMKPQDKLYAEVGGTVNNPNETLASILAFVVAGLLTAVSYFFLANESSRAFAIVMIISIAFFLSRVALFLIRIVAYGTSRQEGREN